MKESVLDILIYLFENYFDTDMESPPNPIATRSRTNWNELDSRNAKSNARWSGSNNCPRIRSVSAALPRSRAIRVFDPREQARLDTECRGYILYLENIGILNAAQRELVIDRLLALDVRQIDIEQVKWVVLMVLFSQPGQENAYLRMEDLVFDNRLDAVH